MAFFVIDGLAIDLLLFLRLNRIHKPEDFSAYQVPSFFFHLKMHKP